KHSFCKSMMGSEKHGQSATLEYEMLKVKYHAKETIVAEVYCESKPDEYKQFIEQTNARSKGPQLSLDSEDARCLYYAYCMQTNPTEVKQARDEQGFVKILNNKIKQRVADRTLGKHEARGSTMKKSEETKTATEEVVGTTDKKDDSHTSGQGRDKGSRGRRVGVLRPINPKPLVSQ
ncbi:MAG: hypothetical protein J6Q15_03210, partial [Clostridia bacterium]|nr:hypothetical protein [Clostridia bacterium]